MDAEESGEDVRSVGGWVQVDGAGSSEGVRLAGGVGLLLSGCRRVR